MGNSESSEKAQAQRTEEHQPSALVIVGPSGVGKGTLINKLMAGNDRYGFSCSHTTRAPRQGEKDGVHYHFTTKPAMEKEIADGQFLEHAHVHGNIYGTSVAAVREVAANGKCCILDIDVQGARQVRESGLRAIFVFVAPPSVEELEKRLRGRGTESEEAVQKRLEGAKAEIASMDEDGLYDYVIVNDELDKAFEELTLIAERALAGEIGAAPEHMQAQSEAEAERSAEEAGNSGAAGATAETGGGDHAGDDEQGAGEEEALLQHSSPTDTSAPQGLERWRGKVALVTGASAGIGWAVCEALATAGLRVVAVARRRERLEQLQQTLVAAGVPIADFLPVVCDITKEAEVVALPRIIVKRWPDAGVDVLINNAGLGRNNASLWEGSTASWVEMISINVLGVCMCTREAIQDMKRRGQYGHIINISSMSGHRVPNGASGGAFYAATKHALRALTEGLRQEARAQKVNLRVTAISPGMVETEFYQVSHFNDKNKIASTPYQNMKCLQAEDIAQAVTWALAAPDHVDVNDILIRPVEQQL